jgi:aryl-alcohol dehydrogenase-like predicted oxidoreductase
MPNATTITFAGAQVRRIGLGTNRLKNTPEHAAFIAAAADAGIQQIDTAHLYTGGESEQAIGAGLVGGSDGVVVATKGGFQPGEGRPEVLRAQVEQSLRSLRADSISLYYLHRVHPDTPLEESVGELARLRGEGKIEHIGISNVSIDQLERARAVVPIAAVQNHFNLEERGSEDVVDHCAREGLVFVPYFPLRERHPKLAAVAERHGATESQVTLAWLLRRSPAMLPIPGTLSLEHLRENLGALEIELSDEEFEALR